MTLSAQRRSLVLAAMAAPLAGRALAAPRSGAFVDPKTVVPAEAGTYTTFD